MGIRGAEAASPSPPPPASESPAPSLHPAAAKLEPFAPDAKKVRCQSVEPC